MFAQIPGLSKKADTPSAPAKPRPTTVARLHRMMLRPSFLLWRAQLSIHLLLALCLLLAMFPLFFHQPLWIGLWLISQGLLLVSIRHCHSIWRASVRSLAFNESGWSLVDDCGEHQVELVEKAVVWTWLMVLCFQHKTRALRFHLVLFSDSASARELRRLRVWLRTQTRA